jgi:hypothetical protein
MTISASDAAKDLGLRMYRIAISPSLTHTLVASLLGDELAGC